AALDQEIKDAIAELLGHAAVGFARVLDRAFADAAVQPPTKRLTLGGYLSLLTIPIAWVERKLADGRDRAIVKAMYGEFKKSGRVRESLPEDDRAVRQAHADEVLKRPLEEIEAAELQPIGSKHGTGKPSRDPVAKAPRKARSPKPVREKPVREKVDKKKVAAEKAADNKASEAKPAATSAKSDKPNREHVAPARDIQQPAAASPTLRMPSAGDKPAPAAGTDKRSGDARYYLEMSSDIVDAPSIGNKTARRFQAIGVRTVADFLKGNPEQMAARLKTGWLTADTLHDWQDQATLVCRIPGLRGHDAQLLVGCGLRLPSDIATAEAANLYQKVLAFCETSAGQRVLREATIPDLDEVKLWIRSAREARPAQAA
ncbi:MAG: DUF4332 domain-containing protein, partial [Planctomycetales bacterium]|nr:DUF4332 domain-containing protein [Planctomycetales bacterium]